MCVSVFMHVCAHVCVHVHIRQVCLHIRMCTHMYQCVCVCTCVCLYVCVYVCLCTCVCVPVEPRKVINLLELMVVSYLARVLANLCKMARLGAFCSFLFLSMYP